MISLSELQHVSISRDPHGWHVTAATWGRTVVAHDKKFLVALCKAIDFSGPKDDGGKRVAA
jgi:hypothetical protein